MSLRRSFIILCICFWVVSPEGEAWQTEVEPSQVSGAFLTIHLEVSSPQTIARAWPQLNRLIEDATNREFAITLMFSPQWAEYVFNNRLLDTVHTWETQGHEIAMHHHGPSHATFDGYTNAPQRLGQNRAPGRQPYQGSMEDLLSLITPLSNHGMVTASMTDEDVDWPEGFVYNATSPDNGPPSKEGLLGIPQNVVWAEQDVIQVSKSAYAIERLESQNLAVNLDEIEAGLQSATNDQLIGLNINDDTLLNELDRMWPLFDLLEQYSVKLESVRSLLSFE